MSVREALLALALVVASALVVVGVQRLSTTAAYILSGVLLAALAYFFLVEAD